MGRKITVGITGGIGSGKTYVCRIIKQAGYPVFDTDTAARNEMMENECLRSRLRQLVSPEVFHADGTLNKPVIRKFLHSSPRNAARFDNEVHPCVRLRWRHWAETQASQIVFMECALLYEAKFDKEVDCTMLVAAPESLRIKRVMQRDGIPEETVRKWIAMQLSDDYKMQHADFVVRNDECGDLASQVLKTICDIRSRFVK